MQLNEENEILSLEVGFSAKMSLKKSVFMPGL